MEPNKMSTTYNIKEQTHFTMLDGPESYVNYLNQIPECYGWSKIDGDSFQGMTWGDAINTLTNGSRKYLERAQALIDKMAEQNIFASHQPQIEAGMVGFMANVPAALAGQPYDMWNIIASEEQSITTPINVYVETLVSGGVSHDELISRGVCVLAFVLAMNNIRPVELYTICIAKPYDANRTGGVVVRVPSKPLDIQRAAFMLCDPAYYRRLAFAAMADHSLSNNSYVQWPWNDKPTTNTHEPKMRELLDMGEEDIFIPGGYLFDELMKHDPVQWVKNKIKEHQGSKQGDQSISERSELIGD